MFGKKGYDSRAVANYFVEKSCADGRILTVSELIKLVFLAHGWYLGITGKPLIYHKIEAWGPGPVIGKVYDAFRHQLSAVRHPALTGSFPYRAKFDEDAKEIMDRIYNAYSKRLKNLRGSKSSPATTLSHMTCKEGTPWKRVFEKKGRFARIPNALIKDYYEELAEKYSSQASATQASTIPASAR